MKPNQTQALIRCLLGSVLVGLLCTGCTTIIRTPPNPERESLPDLIPAEMTKAVLGVGVKVQAADAASEATAAKVRDGLRSVLAEDDFHVVESAGDLVLAVQIAAKPFDQSGSYFVYEGEAKARAHSAGLNRQLGEKQFSVRAKRQLGREAAQSALAADLVAQVGPWAQESLLRGSGGLVAEDVVVKLGRLGPKPQEYANQLLHAIQGLNGVESARLVTLSRQSREIAIRTVYYAAKLPDGLLNTLILKNPELKLRAP